MYNYTGGGGRRLRCLLTGPSSPEKSESGRQTKSTAHTAAHAQVAHALALRSRVRPPLLLNGLGLSGAQSAPSHSEQSMRTNTNQSLLWGTTDTFTSTPAFLKASASSSPPTAVTAVWKPGCTWSAGFCTIKLAMVHAESIVNPRPGSYLDLSSVVT